MEQLNAAGKFTFFWWVERHKVEQSKSFLFATGYTKCVKSTAVFAADIQTWTRISLLLTVLIILALCWLIPAGVEGFKRLQYHAVNVTLWWSFLSDLLGILLAKRVWATIMRFFTR